MLIARIWYHAVTAVLRYLCHAAADGVPVDGEVDGRSSPRPGFPRGGMRVGPGGRGRGAMDRISRGGPMMRGRFVTCIDLLIIN